MRTYLDSASLFNPKLVTLSDLRTAAGQSLSRYRAIREEALEPEDRGHSGNWDIGLSLPEGGLKTAVSAMEALPAHQDLDALFGEAQEKIVGRIAARLFSTAHVAGGETIWEHSGETLRGIGWIMATEGPKKTASVHALNWHEILPALKGVMGAVTSYQFLVVQADYLFRTGADAWAMVLVRPSTKVKDMYIAEAELNRWVFSKGGVNIDQIFLLHPCEDFEALSDTKEENVDPAAFFTLSPLNQAIKHMRQPLSAGIPALLTRAMENQRCSNPRTCPICSNEMPPEPENSIYTLHRGGRAVELLEAEGIVDLRLLETASAAARSELKERHYIQLSAIRSERPYVDRPRIADFLASLTYPLFLLDFESTCEVLPPIAGARPWEHVPFMFSVHRIDAPAQLENSKGLSQLPSSTCVMDPDHSRDGRVQAFTKDLVMALNPGLVSENASGGLEGDVSQGTILAYGASLERITLKRLETRCPEYAAELAAIQDRLVDLQIPFQQFWFYHPQQYGKLGLKKILPLVSDLNHAKLDLSSGGQANLVYWFLSHPESISDFPDISTVLQESRVALLDILRDYCSLDTLGLAHILAYLRSLSHV